MRARNKRTRTARGNAEIAVVAAAKATAFLADVFLRALLRTNSPLRDLEGMLMYRETLVLSPPWASTLHQDWHVRYSFASHHSCRIGRIVYLPPAVVGSEQLLELV